ncbi:THO complex subunit 4C-like [Tripterygium wilfordii]|uniref:THO complex subunit 4C-like n=1 Tax=Tripterygium wilfordii TaxID=458696 RepID=UPI0018F82667|nr:THO complex subunit 4C-like [Tripterygium wilfordii]
MDWTIQGPTRATNGQTMAQKTGWRPGARLNGGASSINRGSGQSHRGAIRNGRGLGAARSRGQGRVRGWGRGRKQGVDKSADELDKDLEKHHAEAMQT